MEKNSDFTLLQRLEFRDSILTICSVCISILICLTFFIGTIQDWDLVLNCNRLASHMASATFVFVFSYLFLNRYRKTMGALVTPTIVSLSLLTLLSNAWLEISIAIIFVALSYSFGAKLLNLPFQFKNLTLCCLAGFIAISSATLLLSIFGLVSTYSISLLLILMALLSLKELKSGILGLTEWSSSPSEGLVNSSLESILASLTLALSVGVIVTSFAPTLGFDAFTTHFSLIKQVAEGGSLYLDQSWNSFTAAHQGGHMLRVALYSLLGESLANLGDTISLVLLFCGVVTFAKIYFGSTSALISGLLLISFPLTQHIVNFTYFNIENTVYLFFATWLLFDSEALSLDRRKGFFIGCLFAAFALAVRPDSLLYLAALTPVLLVKLYREKRLLSSILQGLGITVVISGFYYFHAWSLTGNPLYPVPMGEVFSSTPYVPIQPELSVGATENPRFAWPRSLSGLISLPGRLTFSSSQFLESHNLILGIWLPMLIPFTFIGFYFVSRNKPWMATIPLMNFLLWLFSSMVYLRYIFPAVPFLVIATAHGVSSLLSKKMNSGIFYSLLLATALPQLVLNHSASGYHYGFPLPYAIGKEDPDQLIRYQVKSLPLIRYLNKNSPQEHKVFGVGAIFKYHADFPLYTQFRAEKHWQEFASCKSEVCYKRFFKRHEFTHLLANWVRAKKNSDYQVLREFLKSDSDEILPKLSAKNRVELFELKN